MEGYDFNNYQGDWSYWDLQILDRMRKTEDLLTSLSASIDTVVSMLGGDLPLVNGSEPASGDCAALGRAT